MRLMAKNLPTINLGDANSGPITINADMTRPATTDIVLTAGGAINFTTGSLDTASENLTLTPASAESVGVATDRREDPRAPGQGSKRIARYGGLPSRQCNARTRPAKCGRRVFQGRQRAVAIFARAHVQ
jgi:hypothetical protein